MADISFLDVLNERGEGNATLRAVLPGGEVCQISNHICPFKFVDRCPLLYHAFECGSQSRLQASIEASIYAITCLLPLLTSCRYVSSADLIRVTSHHELPPELRPVPNPLSLICDSIC
jgi:hypothetical protein